MTVAVVGTGLIGTSVGLALRASGVDVVLRDLDSSRVQRAVELGAGRPWAGEPVEHAVIAVPPDAVPEVLAGLQAAAEVDTTSDVCSVQSATQQRSDRLGVDLSRHCGAHPMAGAERSGPDAARADLFVDRPWLLVPAPVTSAATVQAAEVVAVACGGVPRRLDSASHDTAMALVSHVPQLVASLLASRLQGAPADVVSLAGPGLHDTTRIAGSDPGLWQQVVAANVDAIVPVLDALAADLARLTVALRSHETSVVRAAVYDLLRRGNAGRTQLDG